MGIMDAELARYNCFFWNMANKAMRAASENKEVVAESSVRLINIMFPYFALRATFRAGYGMMVDRFGNSQRRGDDPGINFEVFYHQVVSDTRVYKLDPDLDTIGDLFAILFEPMTKYIIAATRKLKSGSPSIEELPQLSGREKIERLAEAYRLQQEKLGSAPIIHWERGQDRAEIDIKESLVKFARLMEILLRYTRGEMD